MPGPPVEKNEVAQAKRLIATGCGWNFFGAYLLLAALLFLTQTSKFADSISELQLVPRPFLFFLAAAIGVLLIQVAKRGLVNDLFKQIRQILDSPEVRIRPDSNRPVWIELYIPACTERRKIQLKNAAAIDMDVVTQNSRTISIHMDLFLTLHQQCPNLFATKPLIFEDHNDLPIRAL